MSFNLNAVGWGVAFSTDNCTLAATSNQGTYFWDAAPADEFTHVATPAPHLNSVVAGKRPPPVSDSNELLTQLRTGNYAAALVLASHSGNELIEIVITSAVAENLDAIVRPVDILVIGELRLTAGEVDAGVDAIRTAIAREQTAYMFKSLGWSLLVQGASAPAKEAFARSLERRRRADGGYDLANADPDEMTAAYFLDLVPEEEFINKYRHHPKFACFPWFYVGQRREIEGDVHAAIAAYQRCIDSGDPEISHSVRAYASWRFKLLAKQWH